MLDMQQSLLDGFWVASGLSISNCAQEKRLVFSFLAQIACSPFSTGLRRLPEECNCSPVSGSFVISRLPPKVFVCNRMEYNCCCCCVGVVARHASQELLWNL